jgi:hypothetical protein
MPPHRDRESVGQKPESRMSGSINEAEGTQGVPSAFFVWLGRLGPWLVAALALVAVVATLDGVGETAGRFDGPGLTLDEIFNIQTGVYLWQSLVLEGPGFFTPAGAERVFGQPVANPDHPPLGRLVIGMTHDLVQPRVAGEQPAVVYSTVSARCGSALLFALTIGLVGTYARRWYGAWVGVVAALSLAVMPRVFGHAHLAALETAMGFCFAWTVLYVGDRWDARGFPKLAASATGAATPRWGTVIVAGVLFGLALLTKIQAVLLPIPIGAWCLWRFGWRAVPVMLVFGVIGLAVFFMGWPWLWLDPVANLREYFASKAERPTLYCYYLGERYADVDVPWHYPVVMFLTTVPLGFLALAAWGLIRRSRLPENGGAVLVDSHAVLVACVISFVLAFFALPGITVYDGERLFLVVFPLLAVLIGKGVTLGKRWTVVGLLLLGLAESVWAASTLQPCPLSYYNWLVGGLGGANRLGFEPTYWRDSFSRSFLDEVAAAVPAGSTLYVAPVLHPANRIDLPLLSPILQQHRLSCDSYDDKDPAKSDMRYVLVFRRHADPWSSLEPAPAKGKLLAEVRRDGVQLAALYDLGENRE